LRHLRLADAHHGGPPPRHLTYPHEFPESSPMATTMADAVFRNAAEHPDAVAFRRWKGGGDVTAAGFAAEVVATGKGLVAAGVPDAEFQRRREVAPDATATIIYTSGTTGRAKGVLITHRNFLSNLDGFLDRLGPVFAPGGAVVLFLTLAHIFTRTMQCASVLR